MASSFYIIISITDFVAKIVFHNLCVMKKRKGLGSDHFFHCKKTRRELLIVTLQDGKKGINEQFCFYFLDMLMD